MLLVTEVQGPSTAKVGDTVNYRVTAFNRDPYSEEERGAVNWLVKTADAGALAHFHHVGPELQLSVPGTWSAQAVVVMPYLHSPSTAVAVRTKVTAQPPTVGSAIVVSIERQENRYYASVDGEPAFFLGTEMAYGERRGLTNWSNPPGDRYYPDDFAPEYGDWAWYLLPTMACESHGFYTCLNTYDRARFTFGHLQFGAHTPDDNFVRLLRELLHLPLAAAYFPDLVLDEGRVHRLVGSASVPLETSHSTDALMDYLNPSAESVDSEETDKAARFVDWCVRDPTMRELLVHFGVRHQQEKLAWHATQLPLDGLVDKLCLVVMDILHHGRGGYNSIRLALAEEEPLDALLNIGAAAYGPRIATLRAQIRDLEALGKAGRNVYRQATNSFEIPEAT